MISLIGCKGKFNNLLHRELNRRRPNQILTIQTLSWYHDSRVRSICYHVNMGLVKLFVMGCALAMSMIISTEAKKKKHKPWDSLIALAGISGATWDENGLDYCAWTTWTAWDSCNCQINQRPRTRDVLIKGTCNADRQRQYGLCNCCMLDPPVGCQWGPWSEWSTCYCAFGLQTSKRTAVSTNPWPVYQSEDRVQPCTC